MLHRLKELCVQAAESSICDADMADEMFRLSTANILSQAAMSILSQANKMPNAILNLLS